MFQVLFKTNSYFCWLSFLHSVWVRKTKKWQQPLPDHFDGSEDFFSHLFFLDNGLKSQQGTVQLFWDKIKFEGFTIDFKGNKWLLWSRCLQLDKRKRPEVWKNPPGREQLKLHVNYLQVHVNFRQLRAETAGNRYLWRFLPASAGIFACGSVYLRPSQVILHAPVLQWILKLPVKFF